MKRTSDHYWTLVAHFSSTLAAGSWARDRWDSAGVDPWVESRTRRRAAGSLTLGRGITTFRAADMVSRGHWLLIDMVHRAVRLARKLWHGIWKTLLLAISFEIPESPKTVRQRHRDANGCNRFCSFTTTHLSIERVYIDNVRWNICALPLRAISYAIAPFRCSGTQQWRCNGVNLLTHVSMLNSRIHACISPMHLNPPPASAEPSLQQRVGQPPVTPLTPLCCQTLEDS